MQDTQISIYGQSVWILLQYQKQNKKEGSAMIKKFRKAPEMLSGYYFAYELMPNEAQGYSGIEVSVHYVKDPANGNMLGDVWLRSLELRPDMKILAAYISTDRGVTRKETELKLLQEIRKSEEFEKALDLYISMLSQLPNYNG